ncbi:hypothetical protein [Bartonella tamiae]|uniref:hypothetical protein n=1 Tax=Bartonella tamiae TaxID=373638 RepID=UPI00031426E1|nr:hypothetical protein [Bartonella tamiae]
MRSPLIPNAALGGGIAALIYRAWEEYPGDEKFSGLALGSQRTIMHSCYAQDVVILQ